MFHKIILIPFHPNVLVANIMFAGILSLLILGVDVAGPLGMFMLPSILTISAMFTQYCFDIGNEAVMKAEEPPVFVLKAIQYKAIFFTLIIFSFYKGAISYLGLYIGSIVTSILIPAILSSMIVQDSFIKAINPLEWIGYVWQLKLRYVFLVAILATSMFLLSLIPSGLWTFPKLFLLQTVVIWSFYSLGISLNIYQEELFIQTPDNKAQKNEKHEAKQKEVNFDHTTDAWHRLVAVHKFDEALSDVLDYLNHKGNKPEDLEQVMTEVCSWRLTGLAVKLLPNYLDEMIKLRKTGLAYAKYRLLFSKRGEITIADKKIQKLILQFAMEMGDNEIADTLTAEHERSDNGRLDENKDS